jgi:hypothetical protein
MPADALHGCAAVPSPRAGGPPYVPRLHASSSSSQALATSGQYGLGVTAGGLEVRSLRRVAEGHVVQRAPLAGEMRGGLEGLRLAIRPAHGYDSQAHCGPCPPPRAFHAVPNPPQQAKQAPQAPQPTHPVQAYRHARARARPLFSSAGLARPAGGVSMAAALSALGAAAEPERLQVEGGVGRACAAWLRRGCSESLSSGGGGRVHVAVAGLA